ncbi:Isochorismatase domain-containing protein 2, mitochondrial [Cichlidogyrus casuarinus]|uniref:Isochorismatase domain-containing protein 1 n=1 Tax=Cichlidogyrus casuarinus TaxID=1844966 RepID=A0ABD2QCI4_9PLAT
MIRFSNCYINKRALSTIGSPKLTPGTVLFICDLQEKFRPNIPQFEGIAQVSNRLLNASKILGMQALVTEMYPEGKFIFEIGLGKTVPEVGDLEGIPVFAKKKFSMITVEVEEWLKSSQKTPLERVILCGIETHVCVQSTALDLVSRGIEVHCVADACGSRNPIDRRFAFERMRQSGIFITTCESILLGLLCGSDHTKFREVQKLIMSKSPDIGL